MRIWSVLALSLLLAPFPANGKSRPRSPASKLQASQPPNASQQGPSANPSGAAKIDPEKEADIRQLMDVAGTKAMAQQVMDATEKTLKPLMMNSLPPGDYREKLVDQFFQKFHSKADIQHLLDMVVPIYDKYLSDEEIKGLINFYKTPLGQKTLSVLPKLMGEMQAQGRDWGQNLGRESMQEVLAENPDLAKALQDAAKAARPQ
jgi:uncharacterized protein